MCLYLCIFIWACVYVGACARVSLAQRLYLGNSNAPTRTHRHFHYRQCHSPILSRSSVKGRLGAASHAAKHTLFHLLTIAITTRKASIWQYECAFFCICGIDRFRRVLRHLLEPGHVRFLCCAECRAKPNGRK